MTTCLHAVHSKELNKKQNLKDQLRPRRECQVPSHPPEDNPIPPMGQPLIDLDDVMEL